MFVILKIAFFAMLIGPAMYFRQLTGGSDSPKSIILITMIPGALMAFASMMSPWEGVERFARIVARVGLGAALVQTIMIMTMLGLIAAGYTTNNPGAVAVSVLSTPFVVWHTVRTCRAVLRGPTTADFEDEKPPGKLSTIFSDDNFAMFFGITFVVLTLMLAFWRPENLISPEFLASGGFFWFITVMMIWFRLRKGDAMAAAEGRTRKYGKPAALLTWISSIVLTLGLLATLNANDWSSSKPHLVYLVLLITGIAAIAPFILKLTGRIPWRTAHRITQEGLTESTRRAEIKIPWSSIDRVFLGDMAGHAAVYVYIRNPDAVLAPLPLEISAKTKKRWAKSEAWTGAQIVITAETCTEDFNEVIRKLKDMDPSQLLCKL